MSSQGYSGADITSRIFSSLLKQCVDRSEGSSISEGMEGILELEIMYMVLVVSEEEFGGWLSLRIVMLDSLEC